MKKLVVFTLLASGLAMAHGEEALTPRTYWGDNDAPRSTSRPRTTTKETPTEETLTPQTYWAKAHPVPAAAASASGETAPGRLW